jgi:hypothetical protein
MHQALMLPHQSVDALGAPRLGAPKDGWPTQVKWMYNRHALFPDFKEVGHGQIASGQPDE